MDTTTSTTTALESPAPARDQRGAATAEYAATTAVGLGIVSIFLTLLRSGFGEDLLKMILDFFLNLIGIG